MKRWIALGSFLCLASSGARADSFYCEAQGVYTNCTSQNGYERCQDAVSTGGGGKKRRARPLQRSPTAARSSAPA